MTKVIEAIKIIYPEIVGGFSYWETKPDGSDWENPIDGLIWENKEHAKPTWEQISSNFDSIGLKELKDAKIDVCRKYLKNTDWYALRLFDKKDKDPEGELAYPIEIREKRAKARGYQDIINALTTLEEVESYSLAELES